MWNFDFHLQAKRVAARLRTGVLVLVWAYFCTCTFGAHSMLGYWQTCGTEKESDRAFVNEKVILEVI
jgi:hypothetical protein